MRIRCRMISSSAADGCGHLDFMFSRSYKSLETNTMHSGRLWPDQITNLLVFNIHGRRRRGQICYNSLHRLARAVSMYTNLSHRLTPASSVQLSPISGNGVQLHHAKIVGLQARSCFLFQALRWHTTGFTGFFYLIIQARSLFGKLALCLLWWGLALIVRCGAVEKTADEPVN